MELSEESLILCYRNRVTMNVPVIGSNLILAIFTTSDARVIGVPEIISSMNLCLPASICIALAYRKGGYDAVKNLKRNVKRLIAQSKMLCYQANVECGVPLGLHDLNKFKNSSMLNGAGFVVHSERGELLYSEKERQLDPLPIHLCLANNINFGHWVFVIKPNVLIRSQEMCKYCYKGTKNGRPHRCRFATVCNNQ